MTDCPADFRRCGFSRHTARVAAIALLLQCGVVGIPSAFAAEPARHFVEATITEGTSFAVAAAPDGHAVAFDLHGRLWTVPASGGEARALTDGLYDARLPQWSPDGKRIAFQSYRDGNWHIWMIDEDGANPQQLTSGDSDNREPAWDADGKSLYFSSDRTRSYAIWRHTLASGAVEQVSRDPTNSFSPAVDAHGTLAYLSRGFAYGSPTRVMVRRRSGEAESVFEQQGGRLVGLAWLPDGRLSAVSFDNVWTNVRTALLGVSPTDAASVQLTQPDEDVFPFRASRDLSGALYYTADGKIKQVSADGAERVIEFSARIMLDGPKTTHRSYDFFDRTPRQVKGILAPELSPDGASVVFRAMGDLWTTQDDAAPRRLTADAFVDTDADFSRDGRQLAFVSDRTGAMQIWIRNLATGGDRHMATPGEAMSPTWSPDGRSLAFRAPARDSSELQLLDVETGAVVRIGQQPINGGEPSWSPDGTQIATMVFDSVPSLYREARNAIAIIDVRDGSQRLIQAPAGTLFSAREYMGPEWSPDGQHLAVIIDRDLWLLPAAADAAATEARRLVANVDGGLSWHGDGTQLLFQTGASLRKIDIRSLAVTDVPIDLSWQANVDPERVVLRAGRVFDGVRSEYQRDVDLLIEGNQIVDLVERDSSASRDFGGRLVDASTKTVMPGLIDAHAHLSGSETSDLGRQFLSYGVTTIRSPSTLAYAGLEAREAVASGARPGPRLLFAGNPIEGSRIYYGSMASTTTDAGLEHELRKAVELEYDFIKTYVRLPNDVQRHVAEFAARHDLYVTSHEFLPAAGLGVAGKEHLKGTSRDGYGSTLSLRSRVYGDVPELAAKSGITITPTLALLTGLALEFREHPERFDDPRLTQFLTQQQQDEFKAALISNYSDNVDEMQGSVAELGRSLKKIVDGGGKIIAGTDCPLIACGISLHTELDVATAPGGLTAYQALLTATAWSADAMGIGNQVGRLKPGMVADIIIVDGDPLARVEDTRNVEAVIANGRHFTLDELLTGGN